ncbi:DUF4241 domain-containing protein [Glycomyces endophyticus]|uniref:DUF4241 domain-containing protein n=1 Tax=Glycomyces endophyticus TaxID=480996 RepID=A0ABN2HDJ7_9ACTN
MPYEPDLDALLTEGHRRRWKRAEFTVEVHELAPARLPSGRLLASDGYPTQDDEPFDLTVPPGEYPMYAWVAVQHKRGKEYERRNVALELRIGANPTVSWEMATAAGERVEDLEDEDGYFGFPVDSGRATITDLQTCEALWQWEFSRVEEVFIPKPLPERPVPGLVSAVVDPATGGNLTVVGSGWGDGFYPTFVGRDADGAVTRFVVDFMLFTDA